MACDNLLTYPDFNEEFKIHIDARNLQLGSVITQNGKPINLFSRKRTDPQKMYTATEKELLSTIETLKYEEVLLDFILRD